MALVSKKHTKTQTHFWHFSFGERRSVVIFCLSWPLFLPFVAYFSRVFTEVDRRGAQCKFARVRFFFADRHAGHGKGPFRRFGDAFGWRSV